MVDLAVRYAEALLTAAKRENVLQVVTDEMQFLAHEFSQSANVFRSPVFTVKEQLSTVDYVLSDKFHPLTKQFIFLLASMRRLGGIGRITDTFVKMASKEMGQIDIYITVYEEAALELTSKIVDAACEKGLLDYKYRETVNINIVVDKSLLGGFIAEYDGVSWDCSMRTRLLDIKKVIQRI